MNIEDIKVGETYNVRVKVESIDEDGWLKVRTSEKAISFVLSPKEQEAFSPLPKYDPCCLFKKGDVVRVVERNGRFPYIGWKHILNQCYTVHSDEDRYHKIMIDVPEAYFHIDPAYLELVTPVEELEPYIVKKYSVFFAVEKRNNHTDRPATYDLDFHPHAKEAAEAECARLNAEYRKEQE